MSHFVIYNIFIILVKGCVFMGKFNIPVVPSTTQKSIRFPNYIIDEVEDAIQGKDCTFSAFVIEAVRIALKDIK